MFAEQRIALVTLWALLLLGCQPYPDSETLIPNPADRFSDLGQKRVLRLLQTRGDRTGLLLEYNQPLRFPGDSSKPPEGFSISGVPVESIELLGVATVEVEFERPLYRARTYRATVEPGWRALAGASALEPMVVEWETDRPRLLGWRSVPSMEMEAPGLPDEVEEGLGNLAGILPWEAGSVLELRFDQPVELEGLPALLSLQELKSSREIGLSVLQERREGDGAIVWLGLDRTPAEAARLRLEEGLSAREGPLPSSRAWEAVLVPPGQLGVDFEPSTGILNFDWPVTLEELQRCSRPLASAAPPRWLPQGSPETSTGGYRTFLLGQGSLGGPLLLLPELVSVWGQRPGRPYLLWGEAGGEARTPPEVQARLLPRTGPVGASRELFGFFNPQESRSEDPGARSELLFEALDEQGRPRVSRRVVPDSEGRFWSYFPSPEEPGRYWLQVQVLDAFGEPMEGAGVLALGSFEALPSTPELVRDAVGFKPLSEVGGEFAYGGRDPFGVLAEGRLLPAGGLQKPGLEVSAGVRVWPEAPRWLRLTLRREPLEGGALSSRKERPERIRGWRLGEAVAFLKGGGEEGEAASRELEVRLFRDSPAGAPTMTSMQSFSLPEVEHAAAAAEAFTIGLESATELPLSSQAGPTAVAIRVVGPSGGAGPGAADRVEGSVYRLDRPESPAGSTLLDAGGAETAGVETPGWRPQSQRSFRARLDSDGRALTSWHFERRLQERYLLRAAAYEGDRRLAEALWLWRPGPSPLEPLSEGFGEPAELELMTLDSTGEELFQLSPGGAVTLSLGAAERRSWEGFIWWEEPDSQGLQYVVLGPGERLELKPPRFEAEVRLSVLLRPWASSEVGLAWTRSLPLARPFQGQLEAPVLLRAGDAFEAGVRARRGAETSGSVGLGFEALEWSGLESVGYRQTSLLMKPGELGRATFSYRVPSSISPPGEVELAWGVSWRGGQETLRQAVPWEGIEEEQEPEAEPSSRGLFLFRELRDPPSDRGAGGARVTYFLVVPEEYAGERLELHLPLPGGGRLANLTEPWPGPLWEEPGGLRAVLPEARPGETRLAFELEVMAEGDYLWPAGQVFAGASVEPLAHTGSDRIRLRR